MENTFLIDFAGGTVRTLRTRRTRIRWLRRAAARLGPWLTRFGSDLEWAP